MYLGKVSGPMLDRIDLHVEVLPVQYEELADAAPAEPSKDIRARVMKARLLQAERYKGTGITCNARLTGRLLRQFCPLSPSQQEMLLSAVEQFSLSARAFDRILRVTRTIADLAGHTVPTDDDLFEAIQFRQFECKLRD
jgi:magnesium chelatase family protein